MTGGAIERDGEKMLPAVPRQPLDRFLGAIGPGDAFPLDPERRLRLFRWLDRFLFGYSRGQRKRDSASALSVGLIAAKCSRRRGGGSADSVLHMGEIGANDDDAYSSLTELAPVVAP